MIINKNKSVKVAYFLAAFLGFQGAHQFYLGNWFRGLLLAALIHLPMFWFAYLNDKFEKTGEQIPLAPLLVIFFALLGGMILFAWDLFTLRKQVKNLNIS